MSGVWCWALILLQILLQSRDKKQKLRFFLFWRFCWIVLGIFIFTFFVCLFTFEENLDLVCSDSVKADGLIWSADRKTDSMNQNYSIHFKFQEVNVFMFKCTFNKKFKTKLFSFDNHVFAYWARKEYSAGFLYFFLQM